MSNRKAKLDLSKKDLTNSSSDLKLINSNSNQNIIELDISSNQLERMPLEVLSLSNLTTLDLRNNNFEDFEEVINQLENLKKLTNLCIDIAESSQALYILKKLPNILLLNGNSTREEEVKEEENDDEEEEDNEIIECLDISEKELRRLAFQENNKAFILLIKNFTSIKSNNNSNTDSKEKFEGNDIPILFKQEINSLKNYKGEIPNYLYASKMIHSHNKVLKVMLKQLKDLKEEEKEDNNSINKSIFLDKIAEDLLNLNDSLIEIINYLNPRMDKIQEDYDSALKSLAEMEAVCCNEDKVNQLKHSNDSLLKQLEEVKIKYEARIQSLESENKAITERIFKKASTIIDNSININERTIETKSNQETISQTTRYAKHFVLSSNNTITTNNNNNHYENNNCNTINKLSSRGKVYQITDKTMPNSIMQNKKITLKTLKEMINEIYISKTDHDKKSKENKLPKETMEQHMYTYLNKKYGLKTLIIEWAKNIIWGIKEYSSSDSIVCLFGRIMRNEQEENARLDLAQLSDSISELFEYHLQTKSPLKTKSEISRMMKMKKQTELNEEEWKAIVFNLYEQKEAQVIEAKIASLIQNKHESTMSSCINGKLTREEQYYLYQKPLKNTISYSELTKIVLDYHIKFRDRQLKNFVNLFKKCDKDQDGILNEEEFAELVSSFDEYPEEELNNNIFRFLAIVDPFNYQKVTFSDCISLFNSEMIVINEKEEISLLEKICSKKKETIEQSDA